MYIIYKMNIIAIFYFLSLSFLVQTDGAVEYADWISAEG